MMKRAAGLVLLLALGGSLRAQSVVELSRREKARREALRGHRAIVVTNKNLSEIRKAPAIESSQPAAAQAEIAGIAAANPDQNSSGRVSPPPVLRMVPRVVPAGRRLFDDGGALDGSASGGNLESRLRAARELVALLTTEMNALWQEFYNLNDMTPADVIQQQIVVTYEKLQKAQEAEARLQDQINQRGTDRQGAGNIDRRP